MYEIVCSGDDNCIGQKKRNFKKPEQSAIRTFEKDKDVSELKNQTIELFCKMLSFSIPLTIDVNYQLIRY